MFKFTYPHPAVIKPLGLTLNPGEIISPDTPEEIAYCEASPWFKLDPNSVVATLKANKEEEEPEDESEDELEEGQSQVKPVIRRKRK